MKQTDLGLELSMRRTRKMELLALMDSVIPWPELVAQISAVAPVKATGRPPFAQETMLRLHLLQQLFGLSDFAMEEALFVTPLYREFAGFDANARLPDRVSILRFRHLLEKHKLAQHFFETVNAMLKARGLMLHSGTVIDATIIAAPSSTKNNSGKRDPEMHQTVGASSAKGPYQGLFFRSLGEISAIHPLNRAHRLTKTDGVAPRFFGFVHGGVGPIQNLMPGDLFARKDHGPYAGRALVGHHRYLGGSFG